jgi:hypothetical protein
MAQRAERPGGKGPRRPGLRRSREGASRPEGAKTKVKSSEATETPNRFGLTAGRISIAVGTFLAVTAVVAASLVFSPGSPSPSTDEVAATGDATPGRPSGSSGSDPDDPSGEQAEDGEGAEGADDSTDPTDPDGDGVVPAAGTAGAAGPVVTGGRPVTSPPVGTSSKKVFAHYFPPYPISLDNQPSSSDYYARNYLSVSGEGGKHANYGGLLRDRPAPRPVQSGDWQTKDYLTEVSQAVSAGIDGFTVNIMSIAGDNWNRALTLTRAAASSGTGFVIVPNVDANGSVGNSSATAVADKLVEVFRSPAAYRLPDGRYVLSSFKAEGKDPSWWRGIIDRLRSAHGINVAFIAVFNNASTSNMERFRDFSYGFGNWGARTPNTVATAPNLASTARSMGKIWMQPVAVQDVRPNGGSYAEAGNTETLRASWKKAIDDRADWVQMVTWNDYSEGTAFAVSYAHGRAFLDISAYYVHQFKTGSAPAIRSDALFVTHRIHAVNAQPLVSHRLMQPKLEGSTQTPPRDTVEALVMLTAPARVTVTIGGKAYTFDAPAGVTARTFPLAQGTISAKVERSGSIVVSVTSPFKVVARPNVQDLQYYAVSSVRS